MKKHSGRTEIDEDAKQAGHSFNMGMLLEYFRKLGSPGQATTVICLTVNISGLSDQISLKIIKKEFVAILQGFILIAKIKRMTREHAKCTESACVVKRIQVNVDVSNLCGESSEREFISL